MEEMYIACEHCRYSNETQDGRHCRYCIHNAENNYTDNFKQMTRRQHMESLKDEDLADFMADDLDYILGLWEMDHKEFTDVLLSWLQGTYEEEDE